MTAKERLKLEQSQKESPFANVEVKDVKFEDGRMKLKEISSVADALTDLMKQSNTPRINQEAKADPDQKRQSKYTMNTHSAVFAEVKVDEDLGTIHVTRVVSAIAGGRIVNPKTARSQILGGIVWVISHALHEESIVDQNYGRFISHNLAEYHLPVNAIYHATGKRVRDLPVTIDKLL